MILFTKFMWFVVQGALVQCMETLDRNPEFVNRVDFDGRSPLHLGCAEGRLAVVECLVDRKANIHAMDRWSRYPFDDAMESKDQKVIDFLTQLESDSRDDMLTPRGSRMDASNRSLLRVGLSPSRRGSSSVDSETTDSEGEDDPSRAEAEQELGIIMQTVSSAMLVIDEDGTILAVNQPACSMVGYSMLELIGRNVSDLIDPVQNVDPNVRNFLVTGKAKMIGVASRKLIVIHQNKSLISTLLSISETKSRGQSYFVWSLIHYKGQESHAWFAAAASGDAAKLKELLKDRAFSVNLVDYDKQTALHVAASEDQYECLKVLLANGADPNKLDRQNRTPLMSAVLSVRGQAAKSACAQLLIKSGGYVYEEEHFVSWPQSMLCRGEESLSEIRPDEVVNESKTPLGQGSFGVVHLGRWKGRQVASKRLLIENMEPQEIQTYVREFAQEVNMMRKLRHPNVVQFFGAWLRNPPYLLITDYCSRGSMTTVLEARKGKPLSLKKVLKYGLQIAAGMSYLHSLKPPIIHRDLKPANLLVDEQGNLKIADFGLAKVKPRRLTEKYQMTGETGSYRYMAPEVFRHDKEYTEKVDQYSWAIIMWEFMEGQRFMEGTKAVNVAVAAEGGVRPIFSPNKNYPEGLRKLLQACWAEDPNTRPNFTDIVVAMEHLIEQKPLDKACTVC